jgi:hypothetical protein
MIQVAFRPKIEPGTEAAFVAAWEQCKTRMLGRVAGLVEASIFRRAEDPTRFVCASLWNSIEDWEEYWGNGIPDPEGEFLNNEILIPVRTLVAAADGASHPLHRNRR